MVRLKNWYIMTDAYNKAGAANVYLGQNGNIFIVAARLKMPPKRVRKTISIPKRELCGMALGVQMAAKLIYLMFTTVFTQCNPMIVITCSKQV